MLIRSNNDLSSLPELSVEVIRGEPTRAPAERTAEYAVQPTGRQPQTPVKHVLPRNGGSVEGHTGRAVVAVDRNTAHQARHGHDAISPRQLGTRFGGGIRPCAGCDGCANGQPCPFDVIDAGDQIPESIDLHLRAKRSIEVCRNQMIGKEFSSVVEEGRS